MTLVFLLDTTDFVHETAVVDEPCVIGANTKIWHYSHVQQNATIGKDCILGQNVNIACHVTVGNYVKIQNNVFLYEGVESKFYIKTLVKEGATFGANCTIVCGVIVGRFAFIGAGAVVTKDVPDFAIIVGNLGKIVGWMSEGGIRLKFNDCNEAYCEKSKRTYFLNGQIVIER